MPYTPKVNNLEVLQQGGQAFIRTSGWPDAMKLAANTEAAYDMTAARTAMGLTAGQPVFVIFTADNPFYVDYRKTAVIPAASIANGTSPEMTPTQRFIASDVTSISFIASAATIITMSFYRA